MESSRTLTASAVGLTLLLTVGIAAPLMQPMLAGASHSLCSDAVDNDADGRIDYPQDPDCSSLDDDSEGVGNGAVFVSVTDGRDEVSAGDTLTYVITVRQDRDTSDTVDVSFHLPAQARVQGASDGGSISTTHVSWNDITVFRGGTKTLTVTAYVDPNAQANQLIVARVNAEGAQATDTTMIRNSNVPYSAERVTMTINDGRSTAIPGAVLDYVVTVRNPSNRTFTEDLRVTVGPNLTIDSIYDGGAKSGRDAVWTNVTVGPNSSRTFRLRGIVEPHTRRMAFVDASARMGTVSAVDRTVIDSGDFPTNTMSVSITDGRDRAERGDQLTYTIRLTNRGNLVESHAFVNASIPLYTQFVSSADGSTWDGNNVRWTNLVIPANGTRELRYVVRVRSDAPRNAVLTAGATTMGGASAEDRTGLDAGTFTYDDGAVLAVNSPASSRLVFRKTVDRGEVLPGDRIRYTITIQNRYDHDLTDVVVSDRFSPSELALVSVTDNADIGSGRIDWRIARLSPGQTWQTTYTVSVKDGVRRGARITNSATVTARELDTRTALNTVYTLNSAVMNAMPSTGAGDFIAALEDTSRFLAPVSAAGNPVAGIVSMAVSGLGIGSVFGRKLI